MKAMLASMKRAGACAALAHAQAGSVKDIAQATENGKRIRIGHATILKSSKSLYRNQKTCHSGPIGASKPTALRRPSEESARRKILFGFGRNPLKSPDSDE